MRHISNEDPEIKKAAKVYANSTALLLMESPEEDRSLDTSLQGKLEKGQK